MLFYPESNPLLITIMKRFLPLLIILLTASLSLCISTKNLARADLKSTSGSSSPCTCNSSPSLAQMTQHTPTTDTSLKPTLPSHPLIRNITCNPTLTPNLSTTPSIANFIITTIFRAIVTILSLLNTNFAWRIHGKPSTPSIYKLKLIAPAAHHARQRRRHGRGNLHLRHL